MVVVGGNPQHIYTQYKKDTLSGSIKVFFRNQFSSQGSGLAAGIPRFKWLYYQLSFSPGLKRGTRIQLPTGIFGREGWGRNTESETVTKLNF